VPAEVKEQIRLEVAHVLFIDIVGYSKLSINEQRAVVDELTTMVRGSDQYQKAEAAGRLIKIPTGDGMALVFYTSQEAPAQCYGYAITPAWLRLDPIWDQIRNDPRFQELAAEKP
jgi:hypothetical protein